MLAAGSAARKGCIGYSSRTEVRRNAVSASSRAVARRALELKEYDDSHVASLPWAEPGWRGAFVSSQQPAVQGALVGGVSLLGAILTYFTYTTWGPWVCQNVPLFDRYMAVAPFIQGPLLAIAGVGHFALPKEFCNFYPPQGTWGFWYLPGTPSFHVYWTGVAEILGGVGLTLGAAHLQGLPEWLLPASAFGLFLLVTVVSPSNMYMWTHNCPGPLTVEQLDEQYGPDGAIPLTVHLGRGAVQVILLATFLGLAFHNY